MTGWTFDHSYTKLPKHFFAELNPTPVSDPKLVILNGRLANELGLDEKKMRTQEGAEVFAGNRIPEGARPLAQAYAGHQFGHFTMLGDGRAILLGEHVLDDGRRFDIQLKGSGITPFSRRGDGRAALGPMLREYVISEAMYALGIPTTRSLAVVTTGEVVYRETELEGAVLTRVAASHLRVGTFEYAAGIASMRDDLQGLRDLADYAIARHYPECAPGDYLGFLKAMIKRQASLIAQWMLIGFVHGVMNTDNMAISGETIDYGPCAFIDTYDPSTVFSSIDSQGRYAYGNQANIASWNLARFAETLLPILDEDPEQAVRLAEQAIGEFHSQYQHFWFQGMKRKLGILDCNETIDDVQVRQWIDELLFTMQMNRMDFTNTFRALTMSLIDRELPMTENGFETGTFQKWYDRWRVHIHDGRVERLSMMKLANPAWIPRNHRVEEALQAVVKDDDLSLFMKLLEVVSDPFDYSPKRLETYTNYVYPDQTCGKYRTFCGT